MKSVCGVSNEQSNRDYSVFEQSLLRYIAAGLGVSYEQLSRNYAQMSYSTARASANESWAYFMGRRKFVASRQASQMFLCWLETELSARLNEPLENGAVIHIVPRLAGAKSGGVFQAVLGAAVMAVAIWMPGVGIMASNLLFSLGASMTLGGVAQMLAPKPKTPRTQTTDNGKQNTYFSSLDNMVAQGNVLPVLYGEMRVGSRVVSQEISTADEGDGGQVVVIGR